MALQRSRDENKTPAEAGEGGAAAGKPAATPIKVYSHAGYKRDERPRAFELEGRRLTVLRVKKTWQEESAASGRRKTVFRVHAHDGRSYDIALDGATGQWTLEPFNRKRT